MFGFGILLMALTDFLEGRRGKNLQKHCDVCNQKFASFEEAESHRRESHADAAV